MAFAGDPSRRKFFKRAGVAAGSALLTANQIWAAEHGENLPPNIPSWMQQAGTGVGAAPYGFHQSMKKTLYGALSRG